MVKRTAIIAGFVLVFAAAAAGMFWLKDGAFFKPTRTVAAGTDAAQVLSDSVHSYRADDLHAECSVKDNIFCAIERTVKCTMAPELVGCLAENVPGFVIGKTEETPRPTEMSFKIVKMKPVPESSDLAVYTVSDCNAVWFGLCKGTVVYLLTPRSGSDQWAVSSIYALE